MFFFFWVSRLGFGLIFVGGLFVWACYCGIGLLI